MTPFHNKGPDIGPCTCHSDDGPTLLWESFVERSQNPRGFQNDGNWTSGYASVDMKPDTFREFKNNDTLLYSPCRG